VGLRVTSQRYSVLAYLIHESVHATAEDIYVAVNRMDPRASRATVYNSLRVLTQAGLVREVPGDGTAARFDSNLVKHHHFVCEACGGVEDVPWFELPEGAGQPTLSGRRIRDFEVLFRGICIDCGMQGEKQ
jgi:Fur family transcriptional regulator, peroxide stress response regulator